jgi:hypothetical protein
MLCSKGGETSEDYGIFPYPTRSQMSNTHTLAVDRPMPSEAVHNIYELPSTQNVIAFHHALLGFPTKATLLEGTRRGFLTTFPDLTPENINKYFPESAETQKDHMRQGRQGVRSMKIVDDEELKQQQGSNTKIYTYECLTPQKSHFTPTKLADSQSLWEKATST